jgi:hypothetical protein
VLDEYDVSKGHCAAPVGDTDGLVRGNVGYGRMPRISQAPVRVRWVGRQMQAERVECNRCGDWLDVTSCLGIVGCADANCVYSNDDLKTGLLALRSAARGDFALLRNYANTFRNSA